MNAQDAIQRLTDATPEFRSAATGLASEYVAHFADLILNGETAEIRECARLELNDYFEMMGNGGVN